MVAAIARLVDRQRPGASAVRPRRSRPSLRAGPEFAKQAAGGLGNPGFVGPGRHRPGVRRQSVKRVGQLRTSSGSPTKAWFTRLRASMSGPGARGLHAGHRERSPARVMDAELGQIGGPRRRGNQPGSHQREEWMSSAGSVVEGSPPAPEPPAVTQEQAPAPARQAGEAAGGRALRVARTTCAR